MKKPLLITFLLTFLIILGLGLYLFLVPVVKQTGGVVFYLKPGSSKKMLTQALTAQGVIPLPFVFRLYAELNFTAPLKTGEYLFPQNSTNASIFKQVSTGTGLYYRAFTIIPGWTFAQLKEALAKAPGLKSMITRLTDQQIMNYMGSGNVAPEGEFYPDTYYYTRDVQDLVILRRAYDLMQNRLAEAWANRTPNLPYKDAYQALIVASLIEKEAYLNTERPMIGGVIINRLNKNMLLQIDPTVIYGMGTRYQGKIKKEDLHEDTPYNTYIRKGLPPTPIAIPSQASIDAATKPSQHDYLYFVAKGDGSHQFSKNLLDHNTAVKAAITKTIIKKQTTPYFNESRVQQFFPANLTG